MQIKRRCKGQARIVGGDWPTPLPPTHRVLPAGLGVDVGAVGDEALGDVVPSVERGDVERRAAVVVPGVDERGVLLQQLPHGADVVLVRVPQDERCAGDEPLVVEPAPRAPFRRPRAAAPASGSPIRRSGSRVLGSREGGGRWTGTRRREKQNESVFLCNEWQWWVISHELHEDIQKAIFWSTP